MTGDEGDGTGEAWKDGGGACREAVEAPGRLMIAKLWEEGWERWDSGRESWGGGEVGNG